MLWFIFIKLNVKFNFNLIEYSSVTGDPSSLAHMHRYTNLLQRAHQPKNK